MRYATVYNIRQSDRLATAEAALPQIQHSHMMEKLNNIWYLIHVSNGNMSLQHLVKSSNDCLNVERRGMECKWPLMDMFN